MERGKRDLSKGFIEDSRYTELNTKEIKQLLNKDVKIDNEGRVLISKDDEWREETQWDELIQAVNEDNPDNEDRHCTVEESLRESLNQMKLMREGKIPKRSWNDFMDSLEKTTEKYSKTLSDLEDIKLTKEQRIAAIQDILTDDDTYLRLYEDKCECDVISDIFKQAIDKQNLNKEDIIRMIEEEKIFRGMQQRRYFDKNFLFDDDDDLQDVYKEMIEEKEKQDFIEIRKIFEDYFGSNCKVENIDKERLEQMKIILSVNDEFLTKFKTKEYKRKIDEIKRKAK